MTASVQLFEQCYFEHEGRRLAYESVGDGPAVVLIHGLLLDAWINRELATLISGLGYRVLLLDLLGHGRSEKSSDPKDHRTDFYADQVVGLLDHLGVERAVIGGISLGCLVSLQVAVRYPRRVSGLFLEMPVMEWSAPMAALLLSPILLVSRMAKGVYQPVARLLSRIPRPQKLRRMWLGSLLNTLSVNPDVVAAILHGVLVGPIVPTEAQRRALKMPALVLGHAGDRLHELRDAAVLVDQMRSAQLVEAKSIIELRSNPDRLWPHIEAFFVQLKKTAEKKKS